MSIQDNKVVFDERLKRKRGLIWFLTAVEVTLTVVLGFVIATTKLFSPSADSAAGVPNNLSYQGRLTDTSGNALGGSGTNYCFRFSLYDATSSGNKIWPSGTPATTTLSVVNGVFDANIGSADVLDYNFYPSSTTYLNVEVNTVTSTCTGTWESLTPRQQVLATGYTIAAENVYGDLLRTDVASSIVQIGTGAGVSSSTVKKLALDVANTAEVEGTACSISGTVWYNSHASNTESLICENGKLRSLVQPLLTSYNLQFYTASEHLAAQIGQGSLFFQPMEVAAPVAYDRFVQPIIWSNTSNLSGSGTLSAWVGIYTRTGNTMSLASSTSQTYGVTASGTVGSWSIWGGKRNYTIGWTNTIYPGQYYIGILSRTTTGGAAMSWSNFVASNMNTANSGNFSQAANASHQHFLGLGSYSATTGAMPSSVAFTQLLGSAAVNLRPPMYFFFSST